jgi:AcrR family transcriptional regulator
MNPELHASTKPIASRLSATPPERVNRSVYIAVTIPVGILPCVTASPTPTTTLTPAARRVLDAAAELFYAEGIHAVGVEASAAAAGVTKKTLYDRFGSKDALIAAYLIERRERWQREVVEAVDAADPDDRPLAPFDVLGDWMAREAPRGCGFVNAHAELTAADDAGLRVVHEQKAWTRELFERLAAGAGVDDPRRLAAELFLLHEGATVAYSAARDGDAAATARAAAASLMAAARMP